ncbi:MAG: hypothetical protein KGI60_01330 [Patescibacteria group bacterium]|nr:hypothetical protein [Patescibacteria group bacterium]
MDEFKNTVEQLLRSTGLDFSVDVDTVGKRVNVFLHDEGLVNRFLPNLIHDLDYVIRLIAKKMQIDHIVVDVNNYKKERERLITELAKAAARKALLEKKEVALPAMNAYERRLIHVELATRPDIKTESIGEGESRQVVVKPLE